MRIYEHQCKAIKDSFTSKADEWELFFCINNLKYQQVRKIEAHIKKMKSRKYIVSLKKYPEMSSKLIDRYN
jgi:putative endonuclease